MTYNDNIISFSSATLFGLNATQSYLISLLIIQNGHKLGHNIYQQA